MAFPALRDTSAALSRREELLLKAIARGYSPLEIVSKLAGSDEPKRRKLRRELRILLAQSDEFAMTAQAESTGVALEAVVDVMEAVAERARRGRMDAARVIMEVTGVYSPKSQHDHNHSGSVEIKFVMPRPERRELEEPVVDAEVVEE